MGAERSQRDGIVAAPFTLDSGYTTPAVSDKVKITDDYEVAAATDGSVAIGEVIAIRPASDNTVKMVTVEMRGAKVDTCIAQNSIAAGDRVTIYSATQVRKWISGTDNPDLIYGMALMAATATNPIDVLVR